MCDQRRSTFGVVDMSGDEPREIVSINLNRVQFTLTLFAGCFIIIGGLWATTSLAYGWMERTAEVNYHERINDDLNPPSGEIFIEVEHMIETHDAKSKARVSKNIEGLDRRLSRLEVITALTYEAVTGKEVPSID